MENKKILNFFRDNVDFQKSGPRVRKIIKKYNTQNSKILSGDGYTERLVFGKPTQDSVLDAYDIDKKFKSEWNKFVKSEPIFTINYGDNVKSVFNQVLMVHFLETQDYTYLKFLAFKIYSSKFYKSFPKFLDKNRMKSVLSSLNMRYFIKKYGSMTRSLDALLGKFLATYSLRVKNKTDEDIVYLINGLVTRINNSVANIRDLYYNGDFSSMYEDAEILDRENLRTTTNDAVKFEGILSDIKHDENINGVDTRVLNGIKTSVGSGTKFLPVLKELHKKDSPLFSSIYTDMVELYLHNSSKPSVESAKKDFLKYITSNKKMDGIKKNIDNSLSKHATFKSDNERKECVTTIIRYCAIQLHFKIGKV